MDFNSVYEMLKSGKTVEDIQAEVQKAVSEAEAKIAEEKAAEATAESNKQLLAEGRAHLINAILAYNSVFEVVPQEKVTDEFIEGLEKKIMEVEEQIDLGLKLAERFVAEKADMEDIVNKIMGGSLGL